MAARTFALVGFEAPFDVVLALGAVLVGSGLGSPPPLPHPPHPPHPAAAHASAKAAAIVAAARATSRLAVTARW
jgi:hypothetical protein